MGRREADGAATDQASTQPFVRLVERVAARLPDSRWIKVDAARAIVARYERDDLSTHAGALTYGAFLSLPPIMLLATSVVGFAISDAGRQRTSSAASWT